MSAYNALVENKIYTQKWIDNPEKTKSIKYSRQVTLDELETQVSNVIATIYDESEVPASDLVHWISKYEELDHIPINTDINIIARAGSNEGFVLDFVAINRPNIQYLLSVKLLGNRAFVLLIYSHLSDALNNGEFIGVNFINFDDHLKMG
jgi:hypothetical protein